MKHNNDGKLAVGPIQADTSHKFKARGDKEDPIFKAIEGEASSFASAPGFTRRKSFLSFDAISQIYMS